ncbi:B-cell receptor CD22 [Silurus meridionalis]|nr:B-cell receptor CD22 [Silurus meridionalis]
MAMPHAQTTRVLRKAVLMYLKMAPRLDLIVLLMISGALGNEWSLNYSQEKLCALKGSTVVLRATYTHPTDVTVERVFWVIDPVKGRNLTDLRNDSSYSGRVEYLEGEQNHFSLRLSDVKKSDKHNYCCRIITNEDKERYLGYPGVILRVTDLQLIAPAEVTEGESVILTCKTTCSLTDPTFIWYKNRHDFTTNTFKSNKLHLQRVSSEDAGSYNCAVRGSEHLPSPAQYLSVRYPPKSVSVSISPSSERVEYNPVNLTCSSDANPPVENYTWFKENESSPVGSGQSYRALEHVVYYCEAQNKLGTMRSPAVSITKDGGSGIGYVVGGLGLGALLSAFFWMRIVFQGMASSRMLSPWFPPGVIVDQEVSSLELHQTVPQLFADRRLCPTLVGSEQPLVIELKVDTLLKKEAIEMVPLSDRESGFYSWYFIVTKKDSHLHPHLFFCNLDHCAILAPLSFDLAVLFHTSQGLNIEQSAEDDMYVALNSAGQTSVDVYHTLASKVCFKLVAVHINLYPRSSSQSRKGALGNQWNVKNNTLNLCAVKGSTVVMEATYTHPRSVTVTNRFWFINPVKGKKPTDLRNESGYSGRVEYLGDKQNHFSLRLSDVKKSDEHMYCFRFITSGGEYMGNPRIILRVTDLQVIAPAEVTEGESVILTCKTTCSLTDPTFIWYKNTHDLTTNTFKSNKLHLQRVSSEDAGSYNCAVRGSEHLPSPAQYLSVRCEFY